MITSKLRLFCILQLCIGFSLLLFSLCYPTLGAHYELKKKLLIIESALGDQTGTAWKLSNEQERDTLLKNSQKALLLPESDIEALLKLKSSLVSSFESRSFTDSLAYLLQNPYFFLYTLFSILVPLLLLLGSSSRREALIFLPLLATCFAFDNLFFAETKHSSPEEQLFPSETDIQKAYALNSSTEPYTLSGGLESFLIGKYLKELPSLNPEVHLQQTEEATYRLLVARALVQETEHTIFLAERKSKLFLLFFLIWNVLFTLIAHKECDLYYKPLKSNPL